MNLSRLTLDRYLLSSTILFATAFGSVLSQVQAAEIPQSGPAILPMTESALSPTQRTKASLGPTPRSKPEASWVVDLSPSPDQIEKLKQSHKLDEFPQFNNSLTVSESIFSRSISASPLIAEVSSLNAQLEQARELWRQGELAAAISIYEILLYQNPSNRQIQEELAAAYAANQDYGNSARLLQELTAEAPHDVDLLLQLAKAYGMQGDYPQAFALYDAILSQDPGNLQAQLGRAEFLSWQGERESAIEVYDALLLINPDNPEVLLDRAKLLSWTGQFNDALSDYDAILLQDPNHWQAQLGKAQALSLSERYDDAISAYDEILEQDPDNLEALLGKANSLNGQGDAREAIMLYETILEQDPDNLQAYLGRARATSWFSPEQALELFEEILEQHPDSVDALHGKAKVTHHLGDSEQAIALYENALEQQPDSPELLLGLAQVYYSQQRVRRAVDVIQPLLDRQHPQALHFLNEMRSVEVTVDFYNDSNDSGRSDFLVRQTTRFRIADSDTVQSVSAGLHRFHQDGFQSLTNIPIQIGVEGNIGKVSLRGAAGVDLFDRLAAVPNFNAEVNAPLAPNVYLTGRLEYGPYRFNVETLENDIRALRVGPELYWQIDRATGLFASYRFGSYNDGNTEQEFFVNLERQLGDFFVAANVYGLFYANDPENGYFAPSDFLLFGGEVGWEGVVTDFLQCRLSIGLGHQLLEGGASLGNTYQARCGAQISPNVEASLGYRYSTVIDDVTDNGDSANQTVSGQLRFTF